MNGGMRQEEANAQKNEHFSPPLLYQERMYQTNHDDEAQFYCLVSLHSCAKYS